jgi:hypothetical protein
MAQKSTCDIDHGCPFFPIYARGSTHMQRGKSCSNGSEERHVGEETTWADAPAKPKRRGTRIPDIGIAREGSIGVW